jgi:hypothetical protein
MVSGFPAILEKTITVGALGFNTTNLASFSSKGPGEEYKQKPTIVAPGKILI